MTEEDLETTEGEEVDLLSVLLEKDGTTPLVVECRSPSLFQKTVVPEN